MAVSQWIPIAASKVERVSMPLSPHAAVSCYIFHLNGLVQDCSNSIANALELLQSCTKPWIWSICLEARWNHFCNMANNKMHCHPLQWNKTFKMYPAAAPFTDMV